MSTSSQIRSAWNTAVWTNASITTITSKILAFDGAASLKSKVEAQNLYYNAKINFFQYLVMRERESKEIRQANSAARYIFDVEVSYFLEKDLSDSAYNYNNVIDRLETVDGLVLTGLGKTWSSTVNFAEMSSVQPPKLVTLDEKEVWHGVLNYRAFNNT